MAHLIHEDEFSVSIMGRDYTMNRYEKHATGIVRYIQYNTLLYMLDLDQKYYVF